MVAKQKRGPKTVTVDPGPGWHLLTSKAVIREGDEWWHHSFGWQVDHTAIGSTVEQAGRPYGGIIYRRRIDAPTNANPSPRTVPADHYGDPSDPYEPIKVIRAWDLNFNRGSVLKYIARAGKKGPEIEDLKKARDYLMREITFMERGE